jgi:integrase
MDLAYLTGLPTVRPARIAVGSDIGDFVDVRQRKDRQPAGIRRDGLSAEVLDALRDRKVLGLYVIAGDKGRPITVRRLQRQYAKARDAAGVKDSGFHDIRALAATDARKQGLDATALLGHRSEQQTQTYLRDFEAVKATPLKQVL